MPTMPNSWIPTPAGVIGTNARAVTRGWMRKYPIQGICVIPKAKPKKYHSKPFRIQQATVIRMISGTARRVFWALSLYSSSFPIKLPVNLLRNREFAMRSKNDIARRDHVKAASTIAPVSINAMPNPAMRSPRFIPAKEPNWSQLFSGTVSNRKITAPMPPATFARNSIVCMPKIPERLLKWARFGLLDKRVLGSSPSVQV